MFFRRFGAQQLFDFEDFLFMDPVGSDQNRHVDDFGAKTRLFWTLGVAPDSCLGQELSNGIVGVQFDEILIFVEKYVFSTSWGSTII